MVVADCHTGIPNPTNIKVWANKLISIEMSNYYDDINGWNIPTKHLPSS